jgi:hypothetical protein
VGLRSLRGWEHLADQPRAALDVAHGSSASRALRLSSTAELQRGHDKHDADGKHKQRNGHDGLPGWLIAHGAEGVVTSQGKEKGPR